MENMLSVLLVLSLVCNMRLWCDVKDLKIKVKSLKEDVEIKENYIKRCHRIIDESKEKRGALECVEK